MKTPHLLVVLLSSSLAACASAAIGDDDPSDGPGANTKADSADAPDGGTATIPSPPSVSVSVSYSGNGGAEECPSASAIAHTFSGTDAVTYLFDLFAVTSPADDVLAEQRACQIRTRFSHTPGWRMRFFTLDARGYAGVEPGGRATINLAASVSGSGNASRSESIPGLSDDDFSIRLDGDANAPWSDCGGSHEVLLDYRMQLQPSTFDFVQTDSLDLIVEWQEC